MRVSNFDDAKNRETRSLYQGVEHPTDRDKNKTIIIQHLYQQKKEMLPTIYGRTQAGEQLRVSC